MEIQAGLPRPGSTEEGEYENNYADDGGCQDD